MADKKQSDSQEKKQGGNRRKCGDADFALAYLLEVNRGKWLTIKGIQSAFCDLYGGSQSCLEEKSLAKHLDYFVDWSSKTMEHIAAGEMAPHPFPPHIEADDSGQDSKKRYRLVHDQSMESLVGSFESKFITDRAQFALLENGGTSVGELRQRCEKSGDDSPFVSEDRLLLTALELKEAIENKKKVRFRVFHIGAKRREGGLKAKDGYAPADLVRVDGTLEDVRASFCVEAWPLALEFADGSLYLLVNAKKDNGRREVFRSFDLAIIQDLEVFDGGERPEVDECQIGEYLDSAIYGCGSNAELQVISLLCDEWGLDLVSRRFGWLGDFEVFQNCSKKCKKSRKYRVRFQGYPFAVARWVKQHMSDVEIEDVEVVDDPRHDEQFEVPLSEFDRGPFGSTRRLSAATGNIKKARVSVGQALNSAIIDHPGECDLARLGQLAFRAANAIELDADSSAEPDEVSGNALTDDEYEVLEAYRAYRGALLDRKRACEV